jgi:hypothetical protein
MLCIAENVERLPPRERNQRHHEQTFASIEAGADQHAPSREPPSSALPAYGPIERH